MAETIEDVVLNVVLRVLDRRVGALDTSEARESLANLERDANTVTGRIRRRLEQTASPLPGGVRSGIIGGNGLSIGRDVQQEARRIGALTSNVAQLRREQELLGRSTGRTLAASQEWNEFIRADLISTIESGFLHINEKSRSIDRFGKRLAAATPLQREFGRAVNLANQQVVLSAQRVDRIMQVTAGRRAQQRMALFATGIQTVRRNTRGLGNAMGRTSVAVLGVTQAAAGSQIALDRTQDSMTRVTAAVVGGTAALTSMRMAFAGAGGGALALAIGIGAAAGLQFRYLKDMEEWNETIRLNSKLLTESGQINERAAQAQALVANRARFEAESLRIRAAALDENIRKSQQFAEVLSKDRFRFESQLNRRVSNLDFLPPEARKAEEQRLLEDLRERAFRLEDQSRDIQNRFLDNIPGISPAERIPALRVIETDKEQLALKETIRDFEVDAARRQQEEETDRLNTLDQIKDKFEAIGDAKRRADENVRRLGPAANNAALTRQKNRLLGDVEGLAGELNLNLQDVDTLGEQRQLRQEAQARLDAAVAAQTEAATRGAEEMERLTEIINRHSDGIAELEKAEERLMQQNAERADRINTDVAEAAQANQDANSGASLLRRGLL